MPIKKVDRSPFFDWVGKVKENPQLLKGIPISYAQRSRTGMSISALWLEEKFGIPRRAFLEQLTEEIDTIIELMIHEGIIQDARSSFFDWAEDVLSHREKLWEIPIVASEVEGFGFSISKSWLSSKIGIHRKAFMNAPYKQEIVEILYAMIDVGIIIPGETAETNDIRRRLLGWFNKLTSDQKLKLVMHEGKVSIKHLCLGNKFGDLRSYTNEKSVDSALFQISKELRKLHRIKSPVEQNRRNKVGIDNYFERKRQKYGLYKFGPSNFNNREKRIDLKSIDYIVPIKKWLKRVAKNKTLLSSVQFTKNRSIDGVAYQVSTKWFEKAFGSTNHNVYDYNRELINSVIDLMIQEGLIVEGLSVFINNRKKKITDWFKNLTLEDKLKIPIHSNQISRKFLEQYVGTLPCKSYFADEFRLIEKELLRLGLIIPKELYKTEPQKRESADRSFRTKRAEKTKEWQILCDSLINNASDLIQPTELDPYLQLRHLFAATVHGVEKKSTRRNAIAAYYEYVRFLQSNQIIKPVFLESHLTEFSLVNYRAYLDKKIQKSLISESFANSMYSGLRKAVEFAEQIKGLGIQEIIYEEGFVVSNRVTDTYRPFTDQERQLINTGIQKDINGLSKFLNEYKPTLGGENPLDENLNFKRGCKTSDGCRWIFDNLFNSKYVGAEHKITHATQNSLEKKFVQAMTLCGGLHQVYASWGLATKVDINFLLPYFVRIMQITGLNQQSVCDLNIDSYLDSHPISGGRSCLRYWKERSTGEKFYVMDIFDAKFNWLTLKQGEEVKKCFEAVIYLTKDIRKTAPANLKNKLFIYVFNSSIRQFNMHYLFNPVKKMGKRYGIESGFNLARFRPTFVSEMNEMGVSIREIQLMLGHSSMVTTMKYLDGLDFSKKAKEKLKSTLEKIHQNTFISDHTEQKVSNSPKIIPIFKTPLASCKNIFDPPEFVRKLKSYVPGTPCSAYNKCLSCDNVMLTEEHLPVLFAMERDYLEISVLNRISQTPYGAVVQENLLLLNEILNPAYSDFDEATLAAAKEKSVFIETTVTISGVTT